MVDKEDKERNANDVTTETFIQSPVTTNAPRNKIDLANERRISPDILTETIKGFNRLTLQSKIINSADDHSNKNVDKSDPKKDPLVSTNTSDGNKRKITDTDTTKGNSPHKLMTNREIPAIIQGIIPSVKQTTADLVETSGGALHAVRAILHKEIVTGATRSAAGVLKYPPVVNWMDKVRSIPVDRKTVGIPPRTTTQVRTGTGPSVPPISIGSQKIEGPRRSIIPQEVRNAETLDISINRSPDEHRDPTPSWSKVISRKTFTNKSSDV